MPAPNLFIVYVADAQASARFYGDLFDLEPVFETPAYISFDLGGGIGFSLWSRSGVDFTANPVRTSELCIAVSRDSNEVDTLHEEWKTKGVTIVTAPHDDGFGRTFVAADPDGNLIRVAPLD
ncbi:VOC family protein [Glycomyces sp. NPDC046736]|uniref:VOC family protein n=1 Tax=Glycomyces sp. NPDC046736 TaxID=3155615 RepID=UPI003409A457